MNITTISKRGGRAANRVADHLRKSIGAGRYEPGQYLPSLRKIAADSGVSYMTAVRALKLLEGEAFVIAEPRQGYRVVFTRSSKQLTATLGFLVGGDADDPRLWDETHKSLLTAFQDMAGQQGRATLTLKCAGKPAAQIVDTLQSANISGVAMDNNDAQLIDAIRSAGIAVVLMDACRYDIQVDAVVQDNFQGGFLAGQYLAQQGHREVAWFGNKRKSVHSHERLGGTLAGLSTDGARLAEGFQLEANEVASGVPSEDAIRLARDFLSTPNRPRAVVALWQSMAHALLTAASQLGLSYPSDFEIITWGIREDRNDLYQHRFGQDHIPPMVCWSVQTMISAVMTRLAERHAYPEQAFLRINVPMQLEA